MSKKEENLPEKVKPAGLPDSFLAESMEDAAVTGFENVKPGDAAIPFIGILQAISPQVKKGSPSKIPGAEEGMFFNNVTQEAYPSPITVVPCAFQKAYIEWVPREKGGGFVAQHSDERLLATCKKDEKNNDILPNGNLLVATAHHFILLRKPDGTFERAVISMVRTQLKKSRRWMSQMMAIQLKNKDGHLFRPPMFSHIYTVHSVMESRDQYTWQGFQVSNPEIIRDVDLYHEALRFNSDVLGGLAKTAVPPSEHAEAPAAPEGM